jgi:trk system potassium uptake protein TrkH
LEAFRALKIRKTISTSRLFALGFALIILLGAGLLCLPAASKTGEGIPFINALFTSCSATCVTGLVVYDTWSQFTVFGQVVILLLIQLGGLGFMTFAILITMVTGRKISLVQRINLSEAIGAGKLGGVVKLARRIICGTLLIEGVGAILLYFRFRTLFGVGTSIWYGVFHSISAFCNAGFDLMGVVKPGTSLMYFVADPVVNLTVVSLILLGGIGFIVWDDVLNCRFRFRRFKLHTKIVLVFSLGIIVIPWLLFMYTERGGVYAGMTAGGRMLAALFSAVTPRTAGFNTVDTASLSEGGTLLTVILMIIGAGSGSTGGGVKISTFAVQLLSVFAYMKGRQDVNVMERRLDQTLCRRAFCSVLLYIGIALGASYVISAVQPLPLKNIMFEVFSALGTVGLSTGITSQLELLPKIIIILLMYAGRVGSVTVFMAVTDFRNLGATRFPEEELIIG